jgi:hypothetical protein
MAGGSGIIQCLLRGLSSRYGMTASQPPDLTVAISTPKGFFAPCPDAKGFPNVFIVSPLFFQ